MHATKHFPAQLRHNIRSGFLFFVILIYLVSGGSLYAISEIDNRSLNYGANWYNPESAGSAICATGSANVSAGTNTDYAGNQILSQAQMDAIKQNQPFYESAAAKVDIPWAMIAVIHLLESGLKRDNPGRNYEGYYDGIYQILRSGANGQYPPGPVTDQDFQNQTDIAAQFIKGKAALNYPENRNLTASATPEIIKDTLFGYNGRAAAYVRQAQALGYGANEGYEGSVYVMNKADAPRDPAVAASGTWGQAFGGTLRYPANNHYGAYVVYASIAGVSVGGNCAATLNGPTRENVVTIAREELALWQSSQMKPRASLSASDDPNTMTYNKYSYNVNADWCAFFASWVFNKAGYPISSATNGVVSLVDEVRKTGEKGETFSYHPVESGYIPQPGDLVIQKNGVSHTNIVVAVEGNTIEVIGGNQGTTCSGPTSYLCSSVTSYKMDINRKENTGFVSPTN